MKKNRIYIFLAVLISFLSVSCEKQEPQDQGKEDTESSAPAVSITGTEVTSTSIAFTFKVENADYGAWICLPAEMELPTVADVFQAGSMMDLASDELIMIENLDPETEYLIAVAVKGKEGEALDSRKVKTEKPEEVPVNKADIVIGAFYRTDNVAAVGQYNIVLSNAVPGSMGEPLHPGDFQMFLNLYNVLDVNPIKAELPAGVYKAGTDYAAFTWNPAADVFMERVDDSEKGLVMMPYTDGTITVSSSGGIYVIEADVTLHNGEVFRACYEGEIKFEMTGSSNERFDADQDVTFERADFIYYGNWFCPHADDLMLDLYAGEFDENGKLKDGYYLTLPVYIDKQADPMSSDIRLPEGVYTVFENTLTSVTGIPGAIQKGDRWSILEEYYNVGTYLQYTDGETGRSLIGLAISGTMTVTHVGADYRLEFDFISSDGVALKGLYEGAMPVDNRCDNETTAPVRPYSTLTSDRTLSFAADTQAELYKLGDYLVPGLTSWVLMVYPESGSEGDMIMTEFFTSGEDVEMSTYQISSSLTAGSALPGFKDFGSELLYTWYGDMSSVDEYGNTTILAPAQTGSFSLSKEGSDYVFQFDFTDDAGYKIQGSWSGPLSIFDATQSSKTAVSSVWERVTSNRR